MLSDGQDRFGERFPKELRLKQTAEFLRVYESGRYAADPHLVVNVIANEGTHSRLGVVVSRKVGKAHDRQRWKRVIRDAFRRLRRHLPAGFDIVVRPRRGATCNSRAIEQSLVRLVQRATRPQHRPSSHETHSNHPRNGQGETSNE